MQNIAITSYRNVTQQNIIHPHKEADVWYSNCLAYGLLHMLELAKTLILFRIFRRGESRLKLITTFDLVKTLSLAQYFSLRAHWRVFRIGQHGSGEF